ncbi:MAG: HD domain-containing protein [Pseudomonadales bacterium]
MVKVRDNLPLRDDGSIDQQAWLQRLTADHVNLDEARIRRACELVRALVPRGEDYLRSGIELAELVAALRMDTASVMAAVCYRPVRAQALGVGVVAASLGEDTAHLVDEVVRMAATSILEMSNTALQTSEQRDQVENVRRMLVALINDARVAVIKLAERVVALRGAKNAAEARKRRIAREAHLIFAPLANRLGIWQLKWELEDLSLRYLAPDIYITIARQLDGRRDERERQVAEIAADLQAQLREQGIDASVSGRAKHIFSIWRKMQAKTVGIDGVYDVRAVRVLVPDIAQCYAALGVIHTQWRHIPSEFDDYVAVPKENGYRSIHTAVLGPDGKTLEVQIRTHEMHAEAELGVCAHWAYKEGGLDESSYTEKMNWLRQVVEWGNEASGTDTFNHGEFGAELSQLFQDERIFVYTPRGHVVDLTTGATPVDFAYRVHTSVGHRCSAALVDGQQVPLNAPLETGQRVEIVTADEEAPDRDWLEEHLGFVRTARARKKILEWFRERAPEQNESDGLARLERMRAALALPDTGRVDWVATARAMGFDAAPELFRAVGCGALSAAEVMQALQSEARREAQLDLIGLPQSPAPDSSGALSPARAHSLQLRALDRRGLLRDVTLLLSEMDVSLVGNSGRTDGDTGIATLVLDLQLPDLRRLAVLVDRLARIDGVVEVRRTSL